MSILGKNWIQILGQKDKVIPQKRSERQKLSRLESIAG